MKRIATLFTITLFTLRLFSQIEIIGTVVDSETNQPLPGASIKLLGTDIGTMSDVDGEFYLSYDYTFSIIDSILKIEVSYIGYISETKNLSDSDSLTVELSPDLTLLSFKDYKIKNSVSLGYYGDILTAPYGVDANYYLQGIGEVFLYFDFNFRFWTDNKNNTGKMFSFNYDIPNRFDYIPDNFHISRTEIDYTDNNFIMSQTKAKLTNVWRLFALDYGVAYTTIDSITDNYYSINFGTYLNLENIYWRLNSIEAFAHVDYGDNNFLYDLGITKGFNFQNFTSFSLTLKYFDYNYISGLYFSISFNLFSTNRMLCCYSWRPKYE